MKTLIQTLFVLLAVFFSTTTLVNAQELLVKLIDAKTKMALSGVHILNQNHQVITISNQKGFFLLKETTFEYPIMIHALGFDVRMVNHLNNNQVIELEPKVIESNAEIVINGDLDTALNVNQYQLQTADVSMDEYISNVDGLNVIQRGAFAWEPSVRGQSDQRLNVMIDGMAVFKACVDKMDPITSYVEVNNLASLKVDKNGASVAKNGNGHASINMRTRKASFTQRELEFESNYKAPSNMYLFRFSTSGITANNKNSYRVSAGYRKANDLVAGDNITIENTQFEKWNLNLSVKSKLSSRLQIETNYITDKAYDVGYPALLMDATSALADILRVQLNVADSEAPLTVRSVALYSNLIRHTMSDYDRDVSTRAVMRDMNMPMYGETFTLGLNTEGVLRIKNSPFKWYLNGYNSTANGTMEMISTLPNIADMFIQNLSGVRTNNWSVGFSKNWLLSNRANLNVEQNVQFVHLASTNPIYNSFFEGLYQNDIQEKIQVLPSISTALLFMVNDELSLSNTFVYSARTGNHIEQYGHYVYNYVDGFFYDGNPWLNNEHALNAEIELMLEKEVHAFSISAFSRYYHQYIDGLITEDIGMPGLQFKTYANVGNALYAGGEIRTMHQLGKAIQLEHRAAYVYAENITLNEPLPLIPPLQGSSNLRLNVFDVTTNLKMDWASAQRRIATTSSIEDETAAYVIFNAAFSKKWNNERISTSLNFRNITNRYYNSHTSIGNIPSEGFSVMLGLSYSLK